MATPLLRASLLRSTKLALSSGVASRRITARAHHPTSRSFVKWFNAKKQESSRVFNKTHVDQTLVHPLSQSPHPDLRARSQRISQSAPCPVCIGHSQHRLAQYECPDCGWPSHCSELHWSEDKEHAKYCSRLQESNADEHDLRSGREIKEFEFPGPQAYEEAVSFANWDVFWFTRGFSSIDSERSRRHVSKILTYPMTVASVLHENSGLTHRNQRITSEGLRSLTALRSSLHPLGNVAQSEEEKALKPPIRIFILGARTESALPPKIWNQISHLFPSCTFQVYMIGPQVSLPSGVGSIQGSSQVASSSKIVEPQGIMPLNSSVRRAKDLSARFGVPSYSVSASASLNIIGIRALYHEIHSQLGPFDPYTDVFFAFSPGFGFPSSTTPPLTQIASPTEWGRDVPLILDTKCSLFVTGFSPTDVERDVRSLDGVEGVSGEFDWILTPGSNPFGSEKWEIADFDPRVMVKTNWGVWGIRGKRRDIRAENEAMEQEADEDEGFDRYGSKS